MGLQSHQQLAPVVLSKAVTSHGAISVLLELGSRARGASSSGCRLRAALIVFCIDNVRNGDSKSAHRYHRVKHPRIRNVSTQLHYFCSARPLSLWALCGTSHLESPYSMGVRPWNKQANTRCALSQRADALGRRRRMIHRGCRARRKSGAPRSGHPHPARGSEAARA